MREVIQGDALAWLEAAGVVAGASFVTSLPDFSELPGHLLETWRPWFVDTARRVLRATPDDGLSVFFQTDVIEDGTWVDKGHLVQCAADAEGVPLLFHRISCRFRAGTPLMGRPGYSHLLAFSRGVKARKDRPRIDVIPDAGRMTWTRAIGLETCFDACRFVAEHTGSTRIIDPFCGHGTVLAVAEAMGFDAVGVELSKKRAQKARNLVLAAEELARVAKVGRR